MPIKHPLKAFTVIELLISMTLTGILVAFSFMGFNQLQKLFTDYNQQTSFISEMNQLNTALFHLTHKCSEVQKQDDKTLVFKSDSGSTRFILNEETILIQFTSHTDTFHFEPKNETFKFLTVSDQLPSKLIKQFDCDVFFKNQKFHVSFQKQYAAEPILKSTLELLPPDELN